MTLSAILRKLAVAGLSVVLGLIAVPLGAAEGESYAETTASVEVRVWQHVRDGRNIYISARPVRGSWRTLGTVPLPLDDGLDPSGRHRYGDIALDVPLRNAASPVTVEVRVWQDVGNDRSIYIGARVSTESWDSLGMIRLPLDDGLSPWGRYRYGDIRLDAPLPGQRVVSLAGRAGVYGYRDGPGDEARFWWRFGGTMRLDVDHDGSVIVADFYHEAIRRISPDGTVSTIAGANGQGVRDGPVATAQFDGPSDVAVGSDGSIYVADCTAHRIRKITTDGMVTTVAGSDHPENAPLRRRDGPAAQALFISPCELALGPSGDLYIREQTRIRRLSPSGRVSTFVGEAGQGYRDGPRESAKFGHLQDIDVDAEGNIYVIDTNDYVPGKLGMHSIVRKISTSGWVSTLYRSDPASDGGLLALPRAIAVTPEGDVYVSNTGGNQIVRIAGRHRLAPVAGTGEAGYLDGPPDKALFDQPGGLAVAPDGALVLTDQRGSMVRMVVPDADGRFAAVGQAATVVVPRLEGVRVSPFAGQGGFGRYPFLGIDGFMNGPARDALFSFPHGLALEADGSILVADTRNHAIRRISPDGRVRTVVGKGEGNRDGSRDAAQFSWPRGIAVDADGVIYVADTGNGLIRRVASDGAVTTVGSRERTFIEPTELAVDPEGNLLLSQLSRGSVLRLSLDGEASVAVDAGNVFTRGLAVDDEGTVFYATSRGSKTTIRKMDADGAVSTLFEDRPGIYGGVLSGSVTGLALAPDGMLYVADRQYGQVVRISPDGEAAIVVGPDSFNDSPHFDPAAILITPEGDLLVADSGMSVIWKITLPSEEEGD